MRSPPYQLLEERKEALKKTNASEQTERRLALACLQDEIGLTKRKNRRLLFWGEEWPKRQSPEREDDIEYMEYIQGWQLPPRSSRRPCCG